MIVSYDFSSFLFFAVGQAVTSLFFSLLSFCNKKKMKSIKLNSIGRLKTYP